MPTLKEIKTRKNAVKSTQKITKAMKMVAASKFRKAQASVVSTRPYASKMSELLSHLARYSQSGADVSVNPLMQEREIKKRVIIVMSSDRGLCGAFNTNIIKYTTKYLNDVGRDTPLIPIGKKVHDYFSKRNYNVFKSYVGFFSDLNITASNEIVALLINGYLENQFDSVEIIYNEFKSVMKQVLVKDQFLPFRKPESKQKGKHILIDYIYEPGARQILDELIPKQLKIKFWKALLESNASEQGARMTAMEMATKNADDLLLSLELAYNRARQEAITNELLEIVSGAEALKKG